MATKPMNDNSQSLKAVFKGLVALGVVALGIAGLIGLLFVAIKTGLEYLAISIDGLDPNIVAAIITAFVSFLAVIVTTVINSFLERRATRREQLVQHRERPYSKFVNLFSNMCIRDAKGKGMSQEKLADNIGELTEDFILWSSDDVIKKWGRWRTTADAPIPPEDRLFSLEEIMFQMRKDLGHKDHFARGDILRLYINDIDETLAKAKSRS